MIMTVPSLKRSFMFVVSPVELRIHVSTRAVDSSSIGPSSERSPRLSIQSFVFI